MAKTAIYLNFPKETEAAFNFYKSVFKTEFTPPGIMRMGDVPPQAGMPAPPADTKNLVMHVSLPILGDTLLMGSDAPLSMGFHVNIGNNVYISLQPDNRGETQRLFDALSAGGKRVQELAEQFWGDYFGVCVDRFGIQWMFNCPSKS